MTSEYLITVVTGSRKGAGTDASVSLVIKGTNGETDALSLDKWFQNDFEAGQKDEYQITAKDVGELLLVTLKNDQGGLYSDWFVNRVTIKIKGKDTVYDFPCNRWVQSETIIFEGAAKLPTDTQHGSVKSQREEELKQRRSLYEWGTDAAYSDLPGYVKASGVKELPRDVQFTEEASYDLHAAGRNALINMGLVHLFNIFDSWDDFDDYRKAFTGFIGEVPKAADHWRDDRFFGYQFLNGCNPDSIKRCTQLPTNFPVTQQLIGNLLDTGDTLEKAMNAGRIYIVDYKILEDIPHYGQDREDLERRYMCASFGLFYVKGSGDLVPIAIQLHQQPSPDNPIWTPNDSDLDWICAKLWLRNADTQYHSFSLRLKFFLVLSRLLLEVANLHVAKGSKTAIGASSLNILLLKNNSQATDSPCQALAFNNKPFLLDLYDDLCNFYLKKSMAATRIWQNLKAFSFLLRLHPTNFIIHSASSSIGLINDLKRQEFKTHTDCLTWFRSVPTVRCTHDFTFFGIKAQLPLVFVSPVPIQVKLLIDRAIDFGVISVDFDCTPEITGDQSEQFPLNTTRCLLFVKKFLIHSKREPSIPCRCSFSNKRSCGVLSKALERSKKMMSVCLS
ncbi:unnamed protein product [Porites evermanni]|uniref:Uncharacterized protein n=1 Tax=Porites evermanni TaxID=104178 RepID=A0ABN8MDZ1_9CNID|nr:unnamed protein product [Porites evermanni]